MSERGERVLLICEQCGNEWLELTSQIQISGKGRFCSACCKYEWRKQKAKKEKICEACGKAFYVGGRGRGSNDQHLCSDACQRASRYRRTTRIPRTMSSTEAAYFAGILDGEGSVMLQQRNEAVALCVAIYNTDKPLFDWIEKTVAVGSIHLVRAKTLKHKASFFWQTGGELAANILKQIRPYLVIKASRADFAIEFAEQLKTPALKADRSWQLDMLTKMKALNKRGPVSRC